MNVPISMPGRRMLRVFTTVACLVAGCLTEAGSLGAGRVEAEEDRGQSAVEPARPDDSAAGKATSGGVPAGESDAASEGRLLTGTRQLTFEGRRAGEGYFGGDGRRLVFQSERHPGNPFFQIYLMDLENGDIERISPGQGKTTCAWIHPDGGRVLFASTHDDPDVALKQKSEYEARQSGSGRRYSWDYDEHFDIFEFDLAKRAYRNLTAMRGYDAEGSWSPDGAEIVFASNRAAFTEALDESLRQRFATDPSLLVDLYIMNADGSNVRQLTRELGYDGGPFFSPDGRRICWRRFSEDGATAEIFTMRVDGSDVRQVTRLGAMSWAPFYHPSGRYLVFTTNLHGFDNFELYLVDVAGERPPVRVTHTPRFDGLASFSPDGARIAWTSSRTSSRQSQLFIADWNHEAALRLLGLDEATASASADSAARAAARETSAEFSPQDILRHVDALCRPEMAGRLTGTDGERHATAYVAAYLDALGLEPAGDAGGWFQEFPFTSGVALGSENILAWHDRRYVVDQQWRPLAFSATGNVEKAGLVFAGYGIVAPGDHEQAPYDSFAHLDVAGKWVMVLRYLPEDITAERRQHLARHASLRYKAMLVRDRGARGMIVVTGPTTGARQELVDLRTDGTFSGSSVPVLSVTDQVAAEWLQQAGRSLGDLQKELDQGEMAAGFEVPQVALSASIDIERIQQSGRNVLGRLRCGDRGGDELIVVGAHIDHLGRGRNASSLARDDELDQVHPGADDNASGVAAMLEIAEYLVGRKSAGELPGRRDVLFAAWSGEELGLLGSTHFVKRLSQDHGAGESGRLTQGGGDDHAKSHHGASPKSTADVQGDAAVVAAHETDAQTLHPKVAACLNLDMVGRLGKQLILQGAGSSSVWPHEIERKNAVVGLPITLQDDAFIPTDASVFYLHGVPVLSAFTGAHAEYHTPRDTPEKINYDGAAQIARLIGLLSRGLLISESPPDYVAPTAARPPGERANLRAYLGTIPDYAESDRPGVLLGGVAAGGPAEKAGLRTGDTIVELAGRRIENIYDYTYAIEGLKIGQPVPVVVLRGQQRLHQTITPGSRE
jgi:Tol biopolymer transport system component